MAAIAPFLEPSSFVVVSVHALYRTPPAKSKRAGTRGSEAPRISTKKCSPGRVDLVFLRRTKAGKGGVMGPALRFCMAPGRGRVMPVGTVKEAVALARRYRDCVGSDRRAQKACLIELPGGRSAPFGGVGSLRLGGTMVRGKRLPGFLRRRG